MKKLIYIIGLIVVLLGGIYVFAYSQESKESSVRDKLDKIVGDMEATMKERDRLIYEAQKSKRSFMNPLISSQKLKDEEVKLIDERAQASKARREQEKEDGRKFRRLRPMKEEYKKARLMISKKYDDVAKYDPNGVINLLKDELARCQAGL